MCCLLVCVALESTQSELFELKNKFDEEAAARCVCVCVCMCACSCVHVCVCMCVHVSDLSMVDVNIVLQSCRVGNSDD